MAVAGVEVLPVLSRINNISQSEVVVSLTRYQSLSSGLTSPFEAQDAAHAIPGEASNSTQHPLKSHNISGLNPSLKTTDKSGEGFLILGARS